MPGRDELIQQNTNKVRASSQAPKPQESAGKTPSGLSAPRSFFGGNYDVYSKLDKVEFQGSLGDDSLRGNVAYIQLWKRQPSKQQSASVPESAVAEIPDSQKQLQEDLEAAIETRDQVANSFDPETQEYGYNPYGDVDNPIEVAESNTQIIENQINQEKQKALSTQTPTSSKPTQSPNTTATPPTTPASKNATPVGTVKSANPGDLGSALTRVGRALIGAGPNQTPHPYSGSAKNGGSLASSVSDDAKWQFLFNPSELELEVGPEFKGAETWGVSDKGNSGQPLHWSHNQNAKLKFNSVLLNGYVFGRKVEALEQGLIELFMARDGDGQHGPHILEFVWGKRVFGPCVIRNVNIKEKMWDEGEVVNAEVSFTLEQVPEWTINDGFVDVARPGRLGTIGDPTIAGSSAGNPGGAGPAGKNPPPGGGVGKPDQKAVESSKTLSESTCERAYYYTGLFKNYQKKINEVNPIFGSRDDTRRIVADFLVKFQNAGQELGSGFATASRATEIYKKTEDILNPNRPGGRLDGGQIKGYVNGYVQEAVNKAGAIYNNSKKCPGTSGATAQPSRVYGGVNTRLSTPRNL